jgi:adenylate cyclase
MLRASALLTAAWLVTIVAGVAAGGALERVLYDRMVVLTAPPANPDVVLVGIDQPSIEELDVRWPWDRGLHGELLEALSKAGARAVAFDVVFEGPGPSAAGDVRFASALAQSGRAVLAAERAQVSAVGYTMVADVLPLATFASVADIGFVEVPVDPDGVLRRHPAGSDGIAARTAAIASNRPPAPLIRWRQPDGWTYVSYWQALDPDQFLPEGLFRDKVVIVGTELDLGAAAGLGRDRFDTPFTALSYGSMSGLRILGHVLADWLSPSGGIAPLPYGATLLSVGIVLLPLGFPATTRRPLATLLVGVGVAAALLAISVALLAHASVWLPVGPGLLALVLAGVATGTEAWIAERRARRRIRIAFGRYVANEVIEEMGRQGFRPADAGSRREVSFLFTDLQGFTRMTEELPSHLLIDVLRGYFDAMTEVIFAHGGTLERFAGDGMTIFFNAPLDQTDHAARAVACAEALEERGLSISAAWQEAGVPMGPTRIGVNTGTVTVGNFGSGQRFHYTAMGSPINLAARLEAANKALGTRVLIGARTAALAGRTELRDVGLVRLKGLAGAVRVYTPPKPGDAPASDYDVALTLRIGEDLKAKEVFATLAETHPEDLLAAFHARRLAGGEGQTIDLSAG